MTWTLDRLKKTGMLTNISAEGMTKLETIFADGTWENWMPATSLPTPFPAINKEYVDGMIAQWEKSGLLEGIEGERPRYHMAQLLENQTTYIKYAKENKCSLEKAEQEYLSSFVLPMVRRAFATLVHLPSFGVIALPHAIDKRGQPIVASTRKMKFILHPDRIVKNDLGWSMDRELELCQMVGDYTKQEFSDILLENTLRNADTYWYVPFISMGAMTDPNTKVRRMGFATRYATSATEKSHEND